MSILDSFDPEQINILVYTPGGLEGEIPRQIRFLAEAGFVVYIVSVELITSPIPVDNAFRSCIHIIPQDITGQNMDLLFAQCRLAVIYGKILHRVAGIPLIRFNKKKTLLREQFIQEICSYLGIP